MIIGISSEGADKLQAMRKDEGLNDKVLMLSDPEGKAAKLYAGANERGYLNAATFVVGKDKKIKMAFFEEDYKKRPKASDILNLLKQQG